jgi:hypothetical protein
MSVRMADGTYIDVKGTTYEQSVNIEMDSKYAGIYCSSPRTGSPNNFEPVHLSTCDSNTGGLNTYGLNAFSNTSGFQK